MSYLKNVLFLLFCILIIPSCSSLSVTERTTINYDDSNVVKIEESIQGIDVYSFVSEDVDENDVIALAPTEFDAKYEANPRDLGVRYIIEDNIIAQLVEHYKVAERDQSLMYYLERETGETFNKYTEKIVGKDSEVNEKAKAPEAQTITNNYYGDISGGVPSVSNAETQENETEFTISTDFVAADKLLTYRVLECGVYFKEIPSTDVGIDFDELDKVYRHAKTRLHCRLEDAKTGIILNAGILEHEIVDRIKKTDLATLQNINYSYYQHTLPTIQSEEGKIISIVSGDNPSPIPAMGNDMSTVTKVAAGAFLLLLLGG